MNKRIYYVTSAFLSVIADIDAALQRAAEENFPGCTKRKKWRRLCPHCGARVKYQRWHKGDWMYCDADKADIWWCSRNPDHVGEDLLLDVETPVVSDEVQELAERLQERERALIEMRDLLRTIHDTLRRVVPASALPGVSDGYVENQLRTVLELVEGRLDGDDQE